MTTNTVDIQLQLLSYLDYKPQSTYQSVKIYSSSTRKVIRIEHRILEADNISNTKRSIGCLSGYGFVSQKVNC